ncbi:hypothetical protein ZYGR_0AK06040 [Zygosaccharomyces rouxii]|uniref:Zn(2)-C6 fungal-type domain-containing protein n=1 Tax=Zygosaccharomyces rouxii TaxID=4956 RepID=A0A1Q3AEJ6_ZYGRO|nr:hypothetical protein ZYGR_0AK06040 [Zygosaccharomyces rouxii]
MAIERDEFDGLCSPYLGNTGLNVNPNSNSNSTASANTGSVTTKKKRRKPIKTCTFCRRRKLRCDQQKPMCSTCVARGLPECVYMESSSKPRMMASHHDVVDSKGSVANTKLLLKVNELERQLRDVANRIGSGSGSGDSNSGDTPQGGTESLVGPSSAFSLSSASPNSTDVRIRAVPQQNELQQQREVQHESQPYSFSDAATSASANPLRKLYVLQSKRNGRKMLYGPTAMRSFLFNGNWELVTRFQQLREKVKLARHEVKKEWGYSMLRENKLIEVPSDSFTTNHTDTSLVRQLIFGLPSYEEIQRCIELFFAKPELYEITEAFDRKKVLNDFKMGFVPGLPSLTSGKRPIINIVPFTKSHYYKIGVILGIVALVRLGVVIPEVLEKFFVFLSGLSTAKTMYVERVQFTLLRYFHRNVHGLSGGDESHEIVLVDSLVCDAISLGLNRNIKVLFQGEDELLGSIDSLEKLWCWVVFLDFSLAFHIGRPVKLTEENIFHEEFFDDDSPGFYGLTKRFLKKIARPIMRSIFNKSTRPDLNKHFQDLLAFTEKEFLPISFYTNRELIYKTPLQETRILGIIFSMLLCLQGLKFFDGSAPNVDSRNSAIKVALVSFSVASNAMARSMEMDKAHFSETNKLGDETPSPYFVEAISMFYPFFIRGISMPYILAYDTLTVFQGGALVLESSDDTLDWDLTTLRAPKSKNLPTIPALLLFYRIFDDLRNAYNIQAKLIRQRCHNLQIILSMEKVQRMVIQEVLEVRTATETTWKSQVLRQDFPSPGKALSPPSMANLENANSNFLGNLDDNRRARKSSSSATASVLPFVQDHSGTPAPEPAIGDVAECEFGTHGTSATAASSTNKDHPAIGGAVEPDMGVFDQEHDIIGMISDDFWESYNSRWAELLNSAEAGNLFSDIDL